MKATATLKAADRNPYSWNMEFYEYPDGSGYEGRFHQMRHLCADEKLGLYDLTPALCRLDYTMSEAGGVTDSRAAVYPCLRRPILRLRI